MNTMPSPPLRQLRQVIHPDYALLPAAELAALVDSVYGPDSAEAYDAYLEGIFGDIGHAFSSAARDVGHFVQQAAPVVAQVGGGALQGAMAGSSLGLPGIIGGAVVGGAGAGLSRYGHGDVRNIGNVLSGVTSVAGQFSPAGRLGASLGGAVQSLAGGNGRPAMGAAVQALSGMLGGGAGGAAAGLLGGGAGGAAAGLLGGGAGNALAGLLGNGAASGLLGGGAGSAIATLFGGGTAAGQLQSLLQRPETQRALAALNLGALGRSSLPVGSSRTQVPVTAITGLIGQLAQQTAHEAAALGHDGEAALRYMQGADGEWVGDPAVESDRASRVWDLLNEAQAERVLGVAHRMAAAAGERAAESAAEHMDDSEEGFDELVDSSLYFDESDYEGIYQ